jgi:F0F1-type ATP synthase membrane subunit b/b'
MNATATPFANLSADERAVRREAELKRRRDEREKRIDAQVERVVGEVRDIGNLAKALLGQDDEKEEQGAS